MASKKQSLQACRKTMEIGLSAVEFLIRKLESFVSVRKAQYFP